MPDGLDVARIEGANPQSLAGELSDHIHRYTFDASYRKEAVWLKQLDHIHQLDIFSNQTDALALPLKLIDNYYISLKWIPSNIYNDTNHYYVYNDNYYAKLRNDI